MRGGRKQKVVHAYIYTHTNTHTYTHIHTHIYMYICIYIYIHTNIPMVAFPHNSHRQPRSNHEGRKEAKSAQDSTRNMKVDAYEQRVDYKPEEGQASGHAWSVYACMCVWVYVYVSYKWVDYETEEGQASGHAWSVCGGETQNTKTKTHRKTIETTLCCLCMSVYM